MLLYEILTNELYKRRKYMSVKNKLKQRLLEIPINWRAYREKIGYQKILMWT